MEKVKSIYKKGDSDIKKKIAELADKMDHKTLAIWAADCVEHVLSYFEEKYPRDNRPRKAVEAGRAWVRGEMSVSEARDAAFAAHAAARDVEEGISRAVARAAGHAAATAHVAGHALHATNYAASVNNRERAWQYRHLVELMRG
jgi:ADP-ribosylglycohydrolase